MPTTVDSRLKDAAEEARATSLLTVDDVQDAMRDILHFTRQRMVQLEATVLARGRELESAIRKA